MADSPDLPETVEIRTIPSGYTVAIKTVTRPDHFFSFGNGYPLAKTTLDVCAARGVERILIDEEQGDTYEFTLAQYQNGNTWCLPSFHYVPLSDGRSPPLVA